jgi:hypothetical protein
VAINAVVCLALGFGHKKSYAGVMLKTIYKLIGYIFIQHLCRQFVGHAQRKTSKRLLQFIRFKGNFWRVNHSERPEEARSPGTQV